MKAEYITHSGDDLMVVNAARVSFDKESEWQNEVQDWEPFVTKKVLSFQDKKLIKYLAKHGHWTPFSHPQITLRETVPIFVARQRFKHMVGFTYNEISRRYVDTIPEFWSPVEWRERGLNKKQGSGEALCGDAQRLAKEEHEAFLRCALSSYEYKLSIGVCPEQARADLPQSMYTSYYVTGSLAAFARMYSLRIKEDSQYEIRELAKSVGEIIRPLFPVSWGALTGSDGLEGSKRLESSSAD